MNISAKEFYQLLIKKFPYQPTTLQGVLLEKLAHFILAENKKGVFLLKGYAGTGKTTTISTLVQLLPKVNKSVVLLAPTGRAAKVIANYSNAPAFTIHKKIYVPRQNANGGRFFSLMPNRHSNTLFIVDEASMIADEPLKLFNQRSLLDDLMTYVFQGKNCQLMLVGDTAQLPPINLEVSPALDKNHLETSYQVHVHTLELTEVTRQHQNSGILFNATQLREFIANQTGVDFRFNVNFPDIIRLTDGYEIQDAIHMTYDMCGLEEVAFIVYSNKRANLYNQQIRRQILGKDGEISVGDYLMVVKNNYHWLEDAEAVHFIANGDVAELLQIYYWKDLYNFHFVEAKLRLIDYPNQAPFDAVMLLDTLSSNTASLSTEKANELYRNISEDYLDEKVAYKRAQAIRKNPFYNALQIKFSYAITCHKAQGGQWDTVFIEKPYLPEGPNISYLRWLYTALTRAKKKVYLIGFNDDDFKV
ncbi:AAA family ATPase [Flavobacteriaceae bacterium F08102]|nr:AAA family ATPase [Flavobacteriaceae bacterium F08102]